MALEGWSPYQILQVIGRFCNMAVAWIARVVIPMHVFSNNSFEKPKALFAIPGLTTIIGQIQPIIDALRRYSE
jgi:hypothetical protein